MQRRYFEIDLAKAEFEKALLSAFADVENALSAEKYLALRISALTKAARLSKDAFQRSREEFANGTGDVLTVLTAQQTMFNQQSSILTLKRQQLEARVDLHLAIAGSFECIECIDTDADPLSL